MDQAALDLGTFGKYEHLLIPMVDQRFLHGKRLHHPDA